MSAMPIGTAAGKPERGTTTVPAALSPRTCGRVGQVADVATAEQHQRPARREAVSHVARLKG